MGGGSRARIRKQCRNWHQNRTACKSRTPSSLAIWDHRASPKLGINRHSTDWRGIERTSLAFLGPERPWSACGGSVAMHFVGTRVLSAAEAMCFCPAVASSRFSLRSVRRSGLRAPLRIYKFCTNLKSLQLPLSARKHYVSDCPAFRPRTVNLSLTKIFPPSVTSA